MPIRKKYLTNILVATHLSIFTFLTALFFLIYEYKSKAYDIIITMPLLNKIAHYSLTISILLFILYLVGKNLRIINNAKQLEIKLFFINLLSLNFSDITGFSALKSSVKLKLTDRSTIILPLSLFSSIEILSHLRHALNNFTISDKELKRIAELEIRLMYEEVFDKIHENFVSRWEYYTIIFLCGNIIIPLLVWNMNAVYSIIWLIYSFSFPVIFLIVLYPKIGKIALSNIKGVDIKFSISEFYIAFIFLAIWYLFSGVIFCQSL